MDQPKKKTGFIKLIVLIVLVLIILGYYGFNVETIMNSPLVKGNLEYAWNLAVNVWNNYLSVPFTFIWDKIIVGIVWNNLVAIVSKVQPAAQTIQ